MEEKDWLVTAEDGIVLVAEEVAKKIADTEVALKQLKADQDFYKERLTALMQENGVTKIVNDKFKVTFFPEDNGGSKLDTAKLKAEHEEVYLECLKKSTTKAFVKIELLK